MNEIIRYLKKKIMLCVLFPFRFIKTQKNRLILDNSLAHNYADNIKPIAEYLIRYYPGKFQIYVAVTEPKKYTFLLSKGIIPIRFHSFTYYKIAMSSAFFITNSGGYSYLPLKKGQTVVNTWHGGGAYKKIGIDAYSASKFYKNELKLAAKKTSLFVSTASLFSDLISNALMMPRHIFLEIGMPRNDVLLSNNDELREQIRQNIGIKKDEKLVLYAPTYRKERDNTFGKSVAIDYGIEPHRVCNALEKRFGGKWRFAFRFHPQIREYKMYQYEDVINLTSYEDMQELLLAADVMINDFSSSMWDFMLTGKPSFLYAKDLQHYIDTTAVYTPVEDWPFPKSTSNNELEKSILAFDEKQYKQNCERHYRQLGGCETGNATKAVCEQIVKRYAIE